MVKSLVIILFIFALFVLISSKIDEKPTNSYENVLKTVEQYLPGNLRPNNLSCYDSSQYNYYDYTDMPVFSCELTNGSIYGKMNVITSLNFTVNDTLLLGDVVSQFGQPTSKYTDNKGISWFWQYQLVVRTNVNYSMNPLYLPIETLYFYDS